MTADQLLHPMYHKGPTWESNDPAAGDAADVALLKKLHVCTCVTHVLPMPGGRARILCALTSSLLFDICDVISPLSLITLCMHMCISDHDH